MRFILGPHFRELKVSSKETNYSRKECNRFDSTIDRYDDHNDSICFMEQKEVCE